MEYATLGEIMLRLTGSEGFSLQDAPSFSANYGGSEANVAVSLARLGEPVLFLSKIPNNPIGEAAISCLRKHGVDTSRLLHGGERLGTYYLEKREGQPSKTVYDRKYSSIALSRPAEFDFEKLLSGCSWLHVSGIMPALSEEAYQITLKSLKTAKQMGLSVSFDLNYRTALWSSEESKKRLSSLLPYADYVNGSIEDFLEGMGVQIPDPLLDKGKLEETLSAFCLAYSLKGAAVALMKVDSANISHWQGAYYSHKRLFLTKRCEISIVDKVGAGDAFAAGLIYGLNHYQDPQEVIDFAAAAGAIKQRIAGDFNLADLKEIRGLLKGSVPGIKTLD